MKKTIGIALLPTLLLVVSILFAAFDVFGLGWSRYILAPLFFLASIPAAYYYSLEYNRFQRRFTDWRLRAALTPEMKRRISSPVRLTWDESQLTEVSDGGVTTIVPWKAVDRVIDFGDRVYINVGGLHTILPERAFEKREDFFEIRDFLELRFRNRPKRTDSE